MSSAHHADKNLVILKKVTNKWWLFAKFRLSPKCSYHWAVHTRCTENRTQITKNLRLITKLSFWKIQRASYDLHSRVWWDFHPHKPQVTKCLRLVMPTY